jgi:6-phosphogluconate dehydrogenase
MALMQMASAEYKYGLCLRDIAKIWRFGIRKKISRSSSLNRVMTHCQPM